MNYNCRYKYIRSEVLSYILSLSALDKKTNKQTNKQTNYEVKINKIKDTIHSRQSLRQWKGRKRIKKGRHQASQESSSWQHHGIHQTRYSTTMACQTLHYSIFLYFYRILLHYYGIFWDLYLISGHFYSICFVSILYSMICIQYIRLFLLYNFRLYCIFSHLHCILLDLYLISGHFYSILLHYYCIFLDLYLISGHFYYI